VYEVLENQCSHSYHWLKQLELNSVTTTKARCQLYRIKKTTYLWFAAPISVLLALSLQANRVQHLYLYFQLVTSHSLANEA